MMLLKFAFSSVYFSFFIWTLRITLTVVLPWRYWEWKITYLQWFQDTKKKLSARINGLDKNLEECAAITESTREDVSKDFLCLILSSSLFNNRISPVQISVIQRKADTISEDSKSFHVAVHVLVNQLQQFSYFFNLLLGILT